MNLVSLFEKAAAVAIKLGQIDAGFFLRPEKILRKATAEEIDFYYEILCKGGKIVESSAY